MRTIIIQKNIDLNGDRVPECVTLSGERRQESAAYTALRLTVQDGVTCRQQELPIPEDAGYQPRLWFGPLTAPGATDVLLSIDSGGSGGIGYFFVYSHRQEQFELIFSSDAYQPRYAVAYQDGCRVRAESLENGMTYLIDLSDRPRPYLDPLYRADCTLIAPQAGDVNPLSALLPVDPDGDGVYDLLAFQRVTGLYNADGLGSFINQLAWNGERFALTNQWLGIFGTAIEKNGT